MIYYSRVQLLYCAETNTRAPRIPENNFPDSIIRHEETQGFDEPFLFHEIRTPVALRYPKPRLLITIQELKREVFLWEPDNIFKTNPYI